MMFLEVQKLSKYFPLKAGFMSRSKGSVKAVRSVSFQVEAGESYGIVGESGSGKTTLGRTILRLITPTSGKIFFNGVNLCELDSGMLRRQRRDMQMIFQDPHSSLNPRKTIIKSVGEPLVIHDHVRGRALRQCVQDLIEIVGLKKEHMYRFPHELSGGEQQRVGLCRAMMLNPRFLLLDEPFGALDPITRSEIHTEFLKLQRPEPRTVVLVTHDLREAVKLGQNLVILHKGGVVQSGSCEEVTSEPADDFVRDLLNTQLFDTPATKTEP